MMVESLMLAFAGSGAGLLLALWIVSAMYGTTSVTVRGALAT
jgi:hypothetical protein